MKGQKCTLCGKFVLYCFKIFGFEWKMSFVSDILKEKQDHIGHEWN
jgi:hypothetical protein